MTPLGPGTLFAHDYRVVRLMARGGMGAVYEVEQLSTGKTRALKVLHDQLATDPKIRQRFEQEARAGARIESDHVVDVVAAGVIEGEGTPWLVMEHLKGVDLAKHLERRGPRPPAEVLEIFRQMGHALAAAHRAGLVHRDLKPENIFLAESRREGAAFTVKVLDFGIAKALADAPGRATMAMGTPFWMAPEQTEASHIIQPATDVWAMGLIAYALLTNACYWRSAAQAEAGVAGVLIEMTTGDLDPPSGRARAYGRDHLLPPGFDGWFLRCVARSPAERFPNAADCVAALAPVLAAAPTGTALTTANHGALVAPTTVPQSAWHGPAPVARAPVARAPAAPRLDLSPASAVAAPVRSPRVPAWVILVAVLATIAACAAVFIGWRLTHSLGQGVRRVGERPGATPAVSVAEHAPSPPAGETNPPTEAAPGPAHAALQSLQRRSAGNRLEAAPGAMSRWLATHETAVLACLRSAAASGEPRPTTTLVVGFITRRDGKVSNVTVSVPSPGLSTCMSARFEALPLAPRHPGSYLSTWELKW